MQSSISNDALAKNLLRSIKLKIFLSFSVGFVVKRVLKT